MRGRRVVQHLQERSSREPRSGPDTALLCGPGALCLRCFPDRKPRGVRSPSLLNACGEGAEGTIAQSLSTNRHLPLCSNCIMCLSISSPNHSLHLAGLLSPILQMGDRGSREVTHASWAVVTPQFGVLAGTLKPTALLVRL